MKHFMKAALVLAVAACASEPARRIEPVTPAPAGPRPVKHGRLSVIDGHVCGADGRPVQLRGMSTAGLQWYPEVVNDAAFAALVRDWKADLVRLTMYVGERGYAVQPGLMQHMEKGIELAIAHGLYVIINWAVHLPGNPNHDTYRDAQAFFDHLSRKYGKHPNLLYEIMSEPNGLVDWAKDLKPYAEKTVATIRANDPEGVILIGSGNWSQDVDIAAADPLLGKNLMYTFHFYAGTHGEALRAKVQAAIDRGAAVFCSEWGTSEASGTGGPYLRAAEEWLTFLNRNTIGWTNWSLCDKSETSAALKSVAQVLREGNTALLERESLLVPETIGPEGYPIWGPRELSPSGLFVRAQMRMAAAGRSAR